MKELDPFQQFALGGSKDADPDNRRTVIYSRVSTKDQEDNTSLANQYQVCIGYVEKENLEVVEEFGGKGESAKQGSARKEYERMLKFVRAKRNRIRYVVFYSYDRFSREGGKAIVTKQELKAMGITVRSATMPIDTSNPYGEGMEDMQLIFAKIENDLRRKRTIDGTRGKLEEGKWCGAAPIGYYWKEGKLLIHPEKGPLIRKAFQWKYKDPSLTNEEVRVRLRKLGLKIPKQTMSRVMRNPLYCGLMAHNVLEGKIVEGNHEPLISKKMFLAVTQAHDSVNARGWTVNEENDLLPLKRFMVCDCCGKPLTGYLNKKKNGKLRKRPIPYYKCRTTACRVSLNADKMGDYFLSELSRYKINQDFVSLIADDLRKELIEMNAERLQEATTLEKRITELDKKLQRLRERYVVEEAVSREDYEEFSKKLREEKADLEKDLSQIRKDSSNLIDRVDEVVRVSSILAEIWTNGGYRDKQRVQKMAFPDGMKFSPEKQKVLTPRISGVIRRAAEKSAILEQKRNGNQGKNTSISVHVPEVRLEPQ